MLLFGWFTGSTAQSDFSGTYMSAVRLVAFADRPCSSDQGVLEISRFSCMLFLSVRGFLDYAGPTVHSRLAWLPCCLPPTRNEVGVLIYGLFAAQSPRPPMPLSTLQETSHDVPCKTRSQDGFATSFPVGLLHPLQHAGLSRRSPSCPSSEHHLMGASPRQCAGGEQLRRYSSVTVCRGVCLTHQRRHKHEREGTPSLNTEVRRCLRSARPPAHPGHAFRGCGGI